MSRTLVTLTFLLCLILLCGVGPTDAAAASHTGGPPRRMSYKRRQAAARAKADAEQAALDEQLYEQRFQHQLVGRGGGGAQKALPSPDDSKKLVPYSGGAAAAAAAAEEEQHHILRSLSVTKLRTFLKEREANCPGCVEKLHLIERAMQVRGWETETERVGKELTPAQFSAENALAFHHINNVISMASGSTAAPLTDANGNQLIPTTQSKALTAVQLSHGIQCSEALGNGTQYCHKVPADDSPAQYM